MARHKRVQPQEEDEPEMDISSLIDVCFLLLIYFIVTTTIVKKEQDVPMSLPSVAPSDIPPEITPMLIRILENGHISVRTEGADEETIETNPDDRKVPALDERLKIYKGGSLGGSTEPVVQIYVDNKAKQQRVMDVLNALAGQKLSKVTFTDLVDPEE